MQHNERVQPFSTGSEYMFWQDRNCCNCKRYNPDAVDFTNATDGCAIELALSYASIDDGTISADIALSYGEHGYLQ